MGVSRFGRVCGWFSFLIECIGGATLGWLANLLDYIRSYIMGRMCFVTFLVDFVWVMCFLVFPQVAGTPCSISVKISRRRATARCSATAAGAAAVAAAAAETIEATEATAVVECIVVVSVVVFVGVGLLAVVGFSSVLLLLLLWLFLLLLLACICMACMYIARHIRCRSCFLAAVCRSP